MQRQLVHLSSAYRSHLVAVPRVMKTAASYRSQVTKSLSLLPRHHFPRPCGIRSNHSWNLEEYRSQPLPNLPPRPEYPCPHLTDIQVKELLYPLYSRGWGVLFDLYAENGANLVLTLRRAYTFRNYATLADFVNETTKIVRKEKHHPVITMYFKEVVITTHTHTATIPGFCDPDPKSPNHKYPGITELDVRLALKLEELYQLGYVNMNLSGKPLEPSHRLLHRNIHPESLQAIIAQHHQSSKLDL
ncbi:hypothetical protein C8Q75DRAFT_803381 [Abortiporus biennis]|nr:hypothetical protein C8Q75DRAFT_803381 [Abortiporus biennis]